MILKEQKHEEQCLLLYVVLRQGGGDVSEMLNLAL